MYHNTAESSAAKCNPRAISLSYFDMRDEYFRHVRSKQEIFLNIYNFATNLKIKKNENQIKLQTKVIFFACIALPENLNVENRR